MDSALFASIDRMVHPRTVAIIGASSREGKVGRLFMEVFIQAGFPILYPVNPREPEVLGFRAYPTVSDLPVPIDLALVVTPPDAVLGVVRECAEHGVGGVIINSAGFGEKGSAGRAIERELGRIARESGTRLLGPNCIGIYCPQSRLPYPMAPPMVAGAVGVVSQSGSFGDQLTTAAAPRGIAFSTVVSVGNECDLTAVDILEYLGQDPATKIIVSYLEGVRDGQRFYRVARDISLRKPVILWKCGVTERGARAASSHTGALAGSSAVWQAVIKQTGIVSANSMEQVMDQLLAFCHAPLPGGRRVAVVSGPGGPAVGAADACIQNGLQLAELSAGTRERLSRLIPAAGTSVDNPVDLGMSVLLSSRLYGDAVEALDSDENIDMLLVIGTPSLAFAEALLASAQGLRKTLAVALPHPPDVIPDVYRRLMHGDIPVYADARRAAEVLARLVAYREFKDEA